MDDWMFGIMTVAIAIGAPRARRADRERSAGTPARFGSHECPVASPHARERRVYFGFFSSLPVGEIVVSLLPPRDGRGRFWYHRVYPNAGRAGVLRSIRPIPREGPRLDRGRQAARHLISDSSYISPCVRRSSGPIPARANSSARSFRSWPAWPLTQCHVHLVAGASAASSCCRRSTFFTGFLSAVRQPLRFQPWIQAEDAVPHILAVGVEVDAGTPAWSVPPAPKSPPSAPCDCWWCAPRRPSIPAGGLAGRIAGSRPNRPGRDCPNRRRRCEW